MLDYTMFDQARRMPGWRSPDTTMEDILKQDEEFELAKAQYALDETNKRIDKANKKQEEINNLTYEKGLILVDVFNVIREDIAQSYYNIFRYFNVGDLLWEAWKYSSFKEKGRLQEIEEAHKKDPKYCKPLEDFENAYNFVLRTVKDRLIPEKYRDESTLVEIVDWWYSTAYKFTFKYKDIEFIICVPMFNNVNDKNYLELLSGYVLRFRESEYCIGLAFNTINPNEFKEKLEKWIDDKLIEKEIK